MNRHLSPCRVSASPQEGTSAAFNRKHTFHHRLDHRHTTLQMVGTGTAGTGVEPVVHLILPPRAYGLLWIGPTISGMLFTSTVLSASLVPHTSASPSDGSRVPNTFPRLPQSDGLCAVYTDTYSPGYVRGLTPMTTAYGCAPYLLRGPLTGAHSLSCPAGYTELNARSAPNDPPEECP